MSQFEWITPDWPVAKNIACLSTTRYGGLSQGNYSSFNLGAHVGDDAQHVKKNRQLLVNELQLSNEPTWLNQQHGKQVIKLTAVTSSNVQADAAYTTTPETVCAVLTADCLPVLFSDQQGSCVAVAHAGWRGLLNGVLENTLHTLPANKSELICWLGPAIGPDKFEVGKEIQHKFVSKDHAHENAFQVSQNGKYFASIYQLAKNILIVNGVQAIYGGEYCTYSDQVRFFSYRRDGVTGRMATLIWIKKKC